MRNKFFILGMALILSFGIMITACNEDNGGGGGGGTLIITNIPAEHNGKDAQVSGYSGNYGEPGSLSFEGRLPANPGQSQYVTVSNGSATFSMSVDSTMGSQEFTASGTFNVTLKIWNAGGSSSTDRNFTGVTLTNGNGTINWNDGN
jgi:hypothetical protein